MNDFWVCAHCKSLNRYGTGRCYSCKQKYGSQPKATGTIRREDPSNAGAVRGPGAPATGFYSGSSVGQGVVGPGGLPVGSVEAEAPAYLSRPMGGSKLTSTAYLNAMNAEPSYSHTPWGWVGNRISRWLAPRQSVSVMVPGYIASVLVTVVLLFGAVLLLNLMPTIQTAVRTGSPRQAWNQLSAADLDTLRTLVIVFGVIAALALFFFSIFVGLSTHNARGLGAGGSNLTPGQATRLWTRLIWSQIRICGGMIAPVILFLAGYPILALIVALVAVELMQRTMDDPFGWLTVPARHLPDLFARMGVSGSGRTVLGTAWKTAFLLANLLVILACALPLVAVTARALAEAAGRPNLVNWHVTNMGPVQISFLAVILPALLAVGLSLGLLIPLSISLVARQKTRVTLTRVGRSRSWVEPPGNYSGSARGTAAAAAAAAAREAAPLPDDDYARDLARLRPEEREYVEGAGGGYAEPAYDRNYPEPEWADRGYQGPGYSPDQGGNYQNPADYQNPGYQDAGYQDPGYQNPGYRPEQAEDSGYENQGYGNQGYQDRGYDNRGRGGS